LVRVDRRAAVFAVMLIVLVSLVPIVRGNPGAHVAVPQSPLSIGQAVYITFWSNAGDPDGSVLVRINKAKGEPPQTDIWESSWIAIKSGIAYDVTAPGLSKAGTYYAGVDWCPNSPDSCAHPYTNWIDFQVVGNTISATDWAVLSVSLNPLSPNVGDLVTFSMVVTTLSSQGSFPQNFAAFCQIDGVTVK